MKNFLELPVKYTSIIEYVNFKEQCSCIRSIFQSERWMNIRSWFNGKIVLPLTVFGDDFEINNPLGSRQGQNKLHRLYCSITAISPAFASKLKNILLIQNCKTRLKKIVAHSKLLNPVVQQIIALQKNGFNITVGGKKLTVYFDIFNLSGDNLELHILLGFHESFNSNYPCRMCYMDN